MLKQLKAAATVGLILTSLSLNAQVTRYERDATRARLLDLVQNPPASKLVIQGEPSSEQAAKFLNYYADKVYPKMEWIGDLIIKYSGLRLLRDSGSQNDQAEFEKWTEEFDKLEQEWNAFSVDEEWTNVLREWAKLAEGLKGELPDYARRTAHERELEQFAPEMKPKLDEIAVLEREYFDAVRTSEAAKLLPEINKTVIQTRRRFKTGEITFEEGRKIVTEAYNRGGGHFVGHEAVQKKGENLNRIAVLRTELAKSKGFNSWADYQLEVSGQGYTPEYRGSANQRKFLRDYLKALKPVQDAFIEQRLKEMGLSARKGEMRNTDIGFLTPPGIEILQPHFPNEKITDMWEKTLIDSGFDPVALKQILIDDKFRESKNPTEAYLSGILGPYNETQEIDATSLNYIPMKRTKPELKEGLVYILQSYKGTGINDLRTAFHEGGHATEKLLKFKDLPVDEAYGYVEVPSLMSEYFTKDPQVLHALAVEVDGKKPSVEEITKLLDNYSKTDIINVAGLAAASLFDLELWSIDYTAKDAPTFVEAVKKVNEETDALAEIFPDLDTKVPFYYHNVSTGHFVSGSVRNIGYDYADIGATMMFEFISDELEKETGRRSWYQQPGFAKIYAEKFVSQGWRKPFPQNIEEITGRKFDYMAVVNDFARKITGKEVPCKDELKPRKK